MLKFAKFHLNILVTVEIAVYHDADPLGYSPHTVYGGQQW